MYFAFEGSGSERGTPTAGVLLHWVIISRATNKNNVRMLNDNDTLQHDSKVGRA